ncbi:uncharacterized protein LOC112527981 [Cynara cardunculus var. scolymus]|uniref:uncharacterized protein LOC112527981 n=1 Tax=Cynara cardunculus var. scolymus TaxID=59895 RepID=UPI000D62940F|nr:uncharacterized protein LOC112527981 [Cynara cardunculus var. scolymus]
MYASLSFPTLFPPTSHNVNTTTIFTLGRKIFYPEKPPKLFGRSHQVSGTRCRARRQVRFEDENDEEYEHNEEIAMLEFYSQVAKNEALLVKAVVDDEEVEILVFKGFSSSLSSGTSFDPTRSILPAKAVIKCIDRVKGPFDPSNIDYIEKDLTVEAFKTVVQKIKEVRDNLQSN